MISAMLFTAQMLSNTAKATIVEENTKVKLYSKGELICLVYDGIKIGTQFVVYEKEGKEYEKNICNRTGSAAWRNGSDRMRQAGSKESFH